MLLEVIEWLEMPWRLRPAELLARHHMQDLAAEAAVAQQRAHILMAREAPIAIFLPFEDRHRRALICVIGRIGIVEEMPDRADRALTYCLLHVDLHVR